MHKDSDDLRNNDTNPTRGKASLGSRSRPSRRQMLTATSLGAAAMAASSSFRVKRSVRDSISTSLERSKQLKQRLDL
jgi:hypothetical protein